MNPLALVPVPYRWAALALLWVASVAFGYVKGVQHELRAADARQAKQLQASLQAQVAAAGAVRAEEHRRQDAVQEIAHELRNQLVAARAADDRNRAAGQRLREQLAGACLAGAAPHPAAAAGSPAADATAGVLALVQRRLAEAEDRTVEFADASRRAGLGCERAFDTMNPKE